MEVALEALFRRDFEAIEAFVVDAIDADDGDFARVDAVAQRVDHAVVLVLEETLFARGEYQ